MISRKECSPAETIERIVFLLKKNSIEIVEKNFSVEGVFFSTRLELKGFSGCGVNGKGVTIDYARASAYAELMERLQGRLLVKPYFLNKYKDIKAFSDEKLLPYEDFLQGCKDLIKPTKSKDSLSKFLQITKDAYEYRYCSEFLNAHTKKTELLPIKIINMLTHSNGLCAGNSYEEAVSHGVFEIFERHVYKQIMFYEHTPPLLNPQNLAILSSYHLLSKLEELGYFYELRDCSMNGAFPVIGVVIFNKDKSKGIFTIGSDLDLDIALQRCLTEAFQGLKSYSDLENKMRPITNDINDKYYNWIMSYVANLGQLPKNLLIHSVKGGQSQFAFYSKITNKEALSILISIIKKQKLNLYVKDLSFLGFPTYKLYIPTMSEIENIDQLNILAIKNRSLLLDVFFNFLCADSDKTKTFITTLYSLKEESLFKRLIKPSLLFQSQQMISSKLNMCSYNVLLFLALLKENRIDDAEQLIKHDQTLLDAFKCVKKPLDTKSAVKVLKLKNSFPSCPHCSSCTLKRKCSLSVWEKLNKKLTNKYNGWILYKDVIPKERELFIEELRPDITQCRIIKIDKEIKRKRMTDDRV